jgi:hypothetical protein
MSWEVVIRTRLAREAAELAYLRTSEALRDAQVISNDPYIPALTEARRHLDEALRTLPSGNLYDGGYHGRSH